MVEWGWQCQPDGFSWPSVGTHLNCPGEFSRVAHTLGMEIVHTQIYCEFSEFSKQITNLQDRSKDLDLILFILEFSVEGYVFTAIPCSIKYIVQWNSFVCEMPSVFQCGLIRYMNVVRTIDRCQLPGRSGGYLWAIVSLNEFNMDRSLLGSLHFREWCPWCSFSWPLSLLLLPCPQSYGGDRPIQPSLRWGQEAWAQVAAGWWSWGHGSWNQGRPISESRAATGRRGQQEDGDWGGVWDCQWGPGQTLEATVWSLSPLTQQKAPDIIWGGCAPKALLDLMMGYSGISQAEGFQGDLRKEWGWERCRVHSSDPRVKCLVSHPSQLICPRIGISWLRGALTHVTQRAFAGPVGEQLLAHIPQSWQHKI